MSGALGAETQHHIRDKSRWTVTFLQLVSLLSLATLILSEQHYPRGQTYLEIV